MDRGNAHTHPDENYQLNLARQAASNSLEKTEMLRKLISATRSINHAKHHEIKVSGDDGVCYYQRKEWVDWMLQLADDAEKLLSS